MAYYKKMYNEKTGVHYPLAVVVGKPIETRKIADRLARISTVSYADVVAVLAELPGVMADYMAQGKSVRLDGFGTFKLGLTTGPSDTAKEFSVAQNVKDVHVLFQPELRIDKNGKRTRTFLDGCKVTALPKNDADDGDEQTEITE